MVLWYQMLKVSQRPTISNIPRCSPMTQVTSLTVAPVPTPLCPISKITNEGVKTLLIKNLNPFKASGPDNIHPKVLKELYSEEAPAVTAQEPLQYSSRHSRKAQSPSSGRQPMYLSPVFKKVDEYTTANYSHLHQSSASSRITLLINRWWIA